MLKNIEKLEKYQVIGLIGEQGAGKTYISSQLAYSFKNSGNDVAILSFATPIRQFLASIGVRKSKKATQELPTAIHFIAKLKEFIEDEELADKYWEKLYRIYISPNISGDEKYRLLAQYIGTELGRAQSEYFWVDKLKQKLDAILLTGAKVIIDDIRFKEEYEVVNSENFVLCEVVRENNPTPQLNTQHASEIGWKQLKKFATYKILNNETEILIK